MPSRRCITKKALHANQDLTPTVRLINRIKTKESVRENENMSNRFTAHSQANPAPLASSILSCGTVETVTSLHQMGLQWSLWKQLGARSTEAWATLSVLTYQGLAAVVMAVEADAPMARATLLLTGETAPIPGRLVHW